MEDLSYPIGKFKVDGEITEAQRQEFIAQIKAAPARIRAAVAGLSPEQIATPYRPGGWTVLQVAHHVPDSHMNAYVRFKLALTEDSPTIRPYMEDRWAELPDGKTGPIDLSLDLLELVHRRWLIVLKSMSPSDFARAYVHPEMGTMTLDHVTAMYAWHGQHHAAHITGLRRRMGWN